MKKDHGKIERTEAGVIVSITGKAHLLEIPGVECINPGDAEAKRIYQKAFCHPKAMKGIYLPHEFNSATTEVLRSCQDIIVLGANGYSSIKSENLDAWGIQKGAYEAACRKMLHATIIFLQKEFSGISIRLTHGSSDLGIDRAIIDVANKLNLSQLGHSCPEFLFYVREEDIINGMPVFVSNNQVEYSDNFVRSLDILIAANGRLQAFEMDIDAIFKQRKYVVFANIIRQLSTKGGPPAFGPGDIIEDAVAAFEERAFMVAWQSSMASGDSWSTLINQTKQVTTLICRRLLPPDRAYSL